MSSTLVALGRRYKPVTTALIALDEGLSCHALLRLAP